MTIYLGESGYVELKRDSVNVPLHSDLDPSDVSVDRKRFSFDFPPTALITGDRVEIGTTDKSDLELVAGHVYPDGDWFIHVDPLRGIRLYDEFSSSLSGDISRAKTLVKPSSTQAIYVRITNTRYNCVAQVKSYTFTTSRETLDLTQLGEEFRRQYADGLITGQGSLSCFWDYDYDPCDGLSSDDEVSNYFAHLAIRVQLGAEFFGRFYLKRPENSGSSKYLWYEARCIITNCSLSFEPGVPVVSQIEFVATEQFTLNYGRPPSYLLQEDGDLILQENGDGIMLDFD